MLNSRFLGVVLTALSSVVFAQSSTRSLYSFTPNQTPTSYLKNLDCAVTFNETRDQPIPKSTDCHAYTFISARGTGESQSQAVSTTAIYPAILASIPGGVYYELEYPATRDFINSGLAGINNLTNYILQKQAACPNEKLIIFGYSQGALVVHGALIADQVVPSGIVAVLLQGDPLYSIGQPYSAGSSNSSSNFTSFGAFGLRRGLPSIISSD